MELIAEILQRHSPRSYSDQPVEREKLSLLFEAARWAPSSNNEQEWLYYYATTENAEAHRAFCDCLMDSNRRWAEKAPVILISCGRKQFARNGRENRHWMHDVGAANVSIALQAARLGLQVHQMAGFFPEKCIELLRLNPEEVEPVTMMVLGYPDSPDKLPDDLRDRELAPRTRKPVEEFVVEWPPVQQ